MINAKDSLFHGAGSEVCIPFTASGDVDYNLIREQLDYIISEGVSSIMANSSTGGEIFTLSESERIETAKVTIDQCKGKVPVAGNIHGNSTKEACELARMYEELGYDAVLIFMPFVYPYTQQELYEYCCDVARATSLPMYMCNMGKPNNFKPATVARIFNDCPSFMGYKDGTHDIIQLQTLLGMIPEDRHFELISGSDAQVISIMQLGGVGIFSFLSCIFPKLVVDTVEACVQNDWDKAHTLQSKAIRVREAVKHGTSSAGYRYAAQLTGHSLGMPRRPMLEPTDAQKEIIKKVLIEEKVI